MKTTLANLRIRKIQNGGHIYRISYMVFHGILSCFQTKVRGKRKTRLKFSLIDAHRRTGAKYLNSFLVQSGDIAYHPHKHRQREREGNNFIL